MQKVEFSYHLVIADDYSTDGTREILLKYKTDHPDLITLILQERNVGAAKNWMDLITYPKTDYIAYFEGDDYWTDPLKLQKQVDFLEKNSDFSIITHVTDILNQNHGLKKRPFKETTYELLDFIKETKVGSATCSILYRNDEKILNDIMSDIFKESLGGDWLICIAALKQGKMKFLADSMAVYRVHSNGIYNSKSWIEKFRIHISTALAVDKLTNLRYHKVIINYNVRRLFLGFVSNSRNLHEKDLLLEYYKLEEKIWRKNVSFIFINSPLKRIYLKYISKLFFFKIHVK